MVYNNKVKGFHYAKKNNSVASTSDTGSSSSSNNNGGLGNAGAGRIEHQVGRALSKLPGGGKKPSKPKRVVGNYGVNTAQAEMGRAIGDMVAQQKGETDALREKVEELKSEASEKSDEGELEQVRLLEEALRLREASLADRVLGFSFNTGVVSANSPRAILYRVIFILMTLFFWYRVWLMDWHGAFISSLWGEDSYWKSVGLFFLRIVLADQVCMLLMRRLAFVFGWTRCMYQRRFVYRCIGPVQEPTLSDDSRPEVIAMGKVKYGDSKLVAFECWEDFVFCGINLSLFQSKVLDFSLWLYVNVPLFQANVDFGLRYFWRKYPAWCAAGVWLLSHLCVFSPRKRDTIHCYMEMFAQLRSPDLCTLSYDQEFSRFMSKACSEMDFRVIHSDSIKLQFEKIQYSARRLNTLNVDRYDFLTGQLYVQNTVRLVQLYYEELRRQQYLGTSALGFLNPQLH